MSIRLENISYRYSQNSADCSYTLDHISFSMEKGEFAALVGHTGSGKSTLVQHLNGLLTATEGAYYFDGENVYSEKYNKKRLRSKVGMTFQYPEHQLFEATVLKDVCFGPMNMGLTEAEAIRESKRALEAVGIPERYYEKSPFELSGGQKRRAAIAGVLAMNPDYLILDEPTAGLDPRGRKKILNLIRQLHEERGMGILLVSHCMEDVAEYAERILVLKKGRLVCDGKPREVFANRSLFEEKGLLVPETVSFMDELMERGFDPDYKKNDRECIAITMEEAKEVILQILRKQGRLSGKTSQVSKKHAEEVNREDDQDISQTKKERESMFLANETEKREGQRR